MMATMSSRLENEVRRTFKYGDEMVTVLQDAGADDAVNVASVTASGAITGATVEGTTSVSTVALTAESFTLSHATLVTATFTTGATAGFTFAVTDTLAALGVTGATGEAEFRIPDNLADAFSIRILSGNDLMVFRTTNSDETVFICPAAGQEVSFFGAAGSPQLSHLADPAADAAALATAFATLIDGLKALGLMAADP